MTLQKTLIGINYLEMFLMSKNIYMKHECQNIILQLSIKIYLGFLVSSTGIALQYFFSPASKEYLLSS